MGVNRHLASGHEISRLQHGLQLIMARYTRTISCRPCCNLYVQIYVNGSDAGGGPTQRPCNIISPYLWFIFLWSNLYDASGGVAVLRVGGRRAGRARRHVDNAIYAERRDARELMVRQRRRSYSSQGSGHVVVAQLILTTARQYHVSRLQHSTTRNSATVRQPHRPTEISIQPEK